MIRSYRAGSIAACVDEGGMEHQAFKASQPVRSAVKVALLVDGDNISSDLAGQVLVRAGRLGQVIVKRVYLDPHHLSNWQKSAGFDLRAVRAGKNAADMLLAIEAVDLAHRGDLDAVVITSSDGGFASLARYLVERGLMVLGLGLSTAPEDWRRSCTLFDVLLPRVSPQVQVSQGTPRTAEGLGGADELIPPPKPAGIKPVASVPSDDAETRVIQCIKTEGKPGILLSGLGQHLRGFGLLREHLSERSWFKYLTARPHLFIVSGQGPTLSVRLTAPPEASRSGAGPLEHSDLAREGSPAS